MTRCSKPVKCRTAVLCDPSEFRNSILRKRGGVDDGLDGAWLHNEKWVLSYEDGRQTQRGQIHSASFEALIPSGRCRARQEKTIVEVIFRRRIH